MASILYRELKLLFGHTVNSCFHERLDFVYCKRFKVMLAIEHVEQLFWELSLLSCLKNDHKYALNAI